jgi:CelD/BcsL family acetyltransferase involved in cellulose biosynthesis
LTPDPVEIAPSFQWIDQVADLWQLKEEWQALVERTEAEVYLGPTWVRVWWDHFGKGRRLLCLVVRRNGRLIGLLPFVVDLFRFPLPARIAHLAGTDPHSMVLRLPVEAESLAPTLQRAVSDLTGRWVCTAVSFTPVSERAEHLSTLRQVALCLPTLMLRERPEGDHVMFDLPSSFSAWLADLSKKRRSQYQRDRRHLEEVFGMQRTVRQPGRAEFAEFAEFHGRQWLAVRKGGHFSDWAGSLAFYCDLADRRGSDGLVRFFHLDGRDAPLATQFTLISGRTAHWRLPARTLDPEAVKFSIGKVGLIDMIEGLIDLGVQRIEAGRGEYGYKLSYGGQSVSVYRILLGRSAGARSLAILLAWSDLIHLLYYRIWFLKLAPRLHHLTGGQPRPLWSYWRKTRL